MSKQFVKGTVLGAIVASIVLVSASAWAGTGVGAVFNLGKTNSAGAQSVLTGNVNGSGKNLQLTNTGSGAALGISVGAGRAPIAVNGSAGKATNLNADKLDGKDSTTFQSKVRKISASTTSAQAGEQPAGSIGSWTFSLTCSAGSGGTADMTIHGPGTVGGTTSLATGGGTATSYVGDPGTIGGGANSTIGTGGQMSQTLFLQNGSTLVEVHMLMTASNGGLFEVCTLAGSATAIS